MLELNLKLGEKYLPEQSVARVEVIKGLVAYGTEAIGGVIILWLKRQNR